MLLCYSRVVCVLTDSVRAVLPVDQATRLQPHLLLPRVVDRRRLEHRPLGRRHDSNRRSLQDLPRQGQHARGQCRVRDHMLEVSVGSRAKC